MRPNIPPGDFDDREYAYWQALDMIDSVMNDDLDRDLWRAIQEQLRREFHGDAPPS